MLHPFPGCHQTRLPGQHLEARITEVVSAERAAGIQLAATFEILPLVLIVGVGLTQQSLLLLQPIIEIAAIHHRQHLLVLHHIPFIHHQLRQQTRLARTHVHLLLGLQFPAGADHSREHAAFSCGGEGRQIPLTVAPRTETQQQPTPAQGQQQHSHHCGFAPAGSCFCH